MLQSWPATCTFGCFKSANRFTITFGGILLLVPMLVKIFSHPRMSVLTTLLNHHLHAQTYLYCTAEQLAKGSWLNDVWKHSEECVFLTVDSPRVRSCLVESDVLITGNSVSRALHFELLELLNYTEQYVDRKTQKELCALPFERMFSTQFELYDDEQCSASSKDVHAHFIWAVDWHTHELEMFYRAAIDEANARGRRLLISPNVMTNHCWPNFDPDEPNCFPLLQKTFPEMEAFFFKILSRDSQTSRHSLIYRTNTHVFVNRPEEPIALQMNEWIREHADFRAPQMFLLDLDEITKSNETGNPMYIDAIHPGREISKFILRMMLHLHCM
jgi:hypothetical protein